MCDICSFYEEFFVGNFEKLKEIGVDSIFLIWCQQCFFFIGYYVLVDMCKVKFQVILLVELFDWYDIIVLLEFIMDYCDIVDGVFEVFQFQFDCKFIVFNMLLEIFIMCQLCEFYEVVYDCFFCSNNFQKKMFSFDILECFGKKYMGVKYKVFYLYWFWKLVDYVEVLLVERSGKQEIRGRKFEGGGGKWEIRSQK